MSVPVPCARASEEFENDVGVSLDAFDDARSANSSQDDSGYFSAPSVNVSSFVRSVQSTDWWKPKGLYDTGAKRAPRHHFTPRSCPLFPVPSEHSHGSASAQVSKSSGSWTSCYTCRWHSSTLTSYGAAFKPSVSSADSGGALRSQSTPST